MKKSYKPDKAQRRQIIPPPLEARNKILDLFYKEQDAINFYSKDLYDIELSYKNEGFIIRGRDATNQLIMIKGLYSYLVSMQGRDKGEPTWLWSNTLIVKVTANQKDKEEFKYISDMVINNFTTKSIINKFE